MRLAIVSAFAIATVMVVSCSVFTKNDPNNDVVAFMQKFETDLAVSDSTALRLFDANQSQSISSIVTALKELRSPDAMIECVADFRKPTILSDSLGLRAIIDVLLKPSVGNSEQVPITFWLVVNQGNYSIKRLDANKFHSRYSRLLYETAVAGELAESTRLLQPYIDASTRLQNTYDSVVWFSTYLPAGATKDSTYYYVINGSWKQPNWNDTLKTTTYKMGLVSNGGKVLVPIEFDLIGSPGALWKDIVEVQKEGKVGYYSLMGKELVPPSYDRVIPYSADRARAIVKRDTTSGWLDNEFVFHSGYPSPEAKQFIDSYEFLAIKMTVSDSLYTLCRIPDPHYIESGTLVLPRYLVDYGLFRPVMTDIIYTGFGHLSEYFSEGTKYVEKGSFNILDLSKNMKLLISAFKGRYIGGREEFYYDNQLTLVSDAMKPTSTKQWGQSIEVRQLNDSILEAKVYSDNTWEPDEYGCTNAPVFNHFRISKNGLSEVPFNGYHQFTKYSLLDSSYFIGRYYMVDYEENIEKHDTLSFAPIAYVKDLQFEILAANGYIFQDPMIADKFTQNKWYKPLIGQYDTVMKNASMHDQHNLKFLETIVGRPKEGEI